MPEKRITRDELVQLQPGAEETRDLVDALADRRGPVDLDTVEPLTIGRPIRLQPQLCRNACGLRGEAPTSRAAWEPPSRAGWHKGVLVMWCPCCERPLREVPDELDVVEDPDGAWQVVRPTSIALDVDAELTRWRDDHCGYDTVWMRKVRGTGERAR